MNHLEIWEAETHEPDSEKDWMKYVSAIESIINVVLATCSESEDGYCIDSAYDAWKSEISPLQYAQGMRA